MMYVQRWFTVGVCVAAVRLPLNCPVTVDESTSAAEAAQTMLEHGFRHLPVIADGRAVGIVSIRDVAEWGVQQAEES